MPNFPIVEEFTLPSLGKVYGREINPNISLRSMTTAEEMRRLAKSDRPLQQMASIIDDCLVDKPGISAYDMIMGDYVFLLHKLRITTYGPEYKMSAVCPFCSTATTETINLDDLFVMQYDDEINKYREFDLPVSHNHITLRMQTPRMVDDVELQTKEAQKHISKPVDSAFLFVLKAVVDTVDGIVLDRFKKDEFLRNLPMRDANYISQYAEKLNNYIGIDTRIIFACDHCGMEYPTTFRANNEFFRPALEF